MILVEIRPRGRKKTTVVVHPRVTVLRGLDEAARRAWASDLAKALQGGAPASIDVEVEVDGQRQVLTPAVATKLGLESDAEVTVFAVDLPGARPPSTPAPKAPERAAPAATTDAEAALVKLRGQLADAERAATEADEALARLRANIDADAGATIPGLEAALELARAATASAQRELADVETRIERVREVETAERAEAQAGVDRLQSERTTLEANRSELVGRMIETGDPGDPKPVKEALNGLRRLRSVKPKPSARAIELADEWVVATDRLAALPAPPQPPEWLVTPALDALQEAREAVAAAEPGGDDVEVDPARVDALDRAHRDVLEAEQRAMKKGSRTNRRRLGAAHEAESSALSALGVSSYGEYLQRVAPRIGGGGGGGTGEERRAAAKAALADAEAVWEELHGGQASPEWTEAKQQQAGIRQEALEVLGPDVDDADLEVALRGHLETVVDTGWAERALVEAMRKAGVPGVDEDADLEAEAARWLVASPPLREARVGLEVELSELDTRLAVVEELLTERQANAFFGDEEAPPPDRVEGSSSVGNLRTGLNEAEADEREAESAVQAARDRVAAAEAAQAEAAELAGAAKSRRREVASLRAQVDDAEADATRAKAEANAIAASNGAVDLSAVVGMEAEAYLLARVAALRGATGGPLPLVVDGAILTELPERAAKRVFRLLGRLADSMQLVVLGDGGEIATWAEGLGDRAAVRTVAR